jgi:hypothetical protein
VPLGSLSRVRHDHPQDPFFRVLACDAAKLQLLSDFTERSIAAGAPPPAELGGGPIHVESTDRQDRRLIVPAGGQQSLTVTGHSASYVSLLVASAVPAWLVYADGYHPLLARRGRWSAGARMGG